MATLNFTVDSRLLRELGERLVGRPHIALAELVKNSYDADATAVVIKFTSDRIEVIDNGHGMTYDDFVEKWLRIGSTHKESQARSRKLQRPLTGSKGVGRLSVQLLATKIEVRSTAARPRREVVASVDWKTAVDAGLLTQAPVEVEEIEPTTTYANGSRVGTRLVLTGLTQEWTAEAFADLAREIWPLRPPFRSSSSDDRAVTFDVTLESPFKSIVQSFNAQMEAVLGLWQARLVGELLPATETAPRGAHRVVRPKVEDFEDEAGESWDVASDFVADTSDTDDVPDRVVRLTLEFADRKRWTAYYALDRCHVNRLTFEIRVFNLQHRQPYGIKVDEARRYLRRFGGVHVYDAGFHLPYYGPDTDWLHIEMDHSHRLSRSRLLPEDLQVPNGQQHLPTNSRLFGVVNVNTTEEQRWARAQGGRAERDALAIQVSRDRLAGTLAYRDLVTLVRWALDFYASKAAARAFERSSASRNVEQTPSRELKKVEDVLEEFKPSIPAPVYDSLVDGVRQAAAAARAEEEDRRARLGLLGALATAGVSALAYEHEVAKQFELLDRALRKLRSLARRRTPMQAELKEIVEVIERWLERARATRNMFSHLLVEENRTKRERFKARALLREVSRSVSPFAAGATIAVDVSDALRLPPGGYAEWTALFQNLIINALNAVAASEVRRIDITDRASGPDRHILIQVTGIGIDLDEAERLFEPFERRGDIDPERAARGLGGTGLGLTIVRMIASDLNCVVRFVKPDARYSTAAEISWRELW